MKDSKQEKSILAITTGQKGRPYQIKGLLLQLPGCTECRSTAS